MDESLTFASLGLTPSLLQAVAETGYTQPTAIQAKAIPKVLAGRDLLGAAQTGTGKTAAFTLPILQRLMAEPRPTGRPGRPRCLILAPTRELSAQIHESVLTYGKHLPLRSVVVFGGVNINPQFAAFRKPLDIVVATPGRLLDHAGQRTVDLSGVEILVLDEADRMLDMGFIRDIKRLLVLLPKARQSLLFSATFSGPIRALAREFLRDPESVDVAPRNTTVQRIEQSVYMTEQPVKRALLAHLIKDNGWGQCLVFTRTKHGANRLAEYLDNHGISAAAIHGNKSQAARTRALAHFKSGEVSTLVATDIAARGLDIEELPQVVNFELPNVPEDYVHRIGRTGRAGSSGQAVSLVDAGEAKLLSDIERVIKQRIPRSTPERFTPPARAEIEAPRPPRPMSRARGGYAQGRGAGGRSPNARSR